MKTMLLILAVFVTASTAPGADALNENFQKGLLEEEANRNLDAAIQAYQSVINQYDDQRKLVVTAVFRLAECYRKQGKTNEAVAEYERVLRDFSDQSGLVGPSERNLLTLRPAGGGETSEPTAANVRTVTDPDQLKLLNEEIELVRKELAATEARFRNGKAEAADIAKSKKELLLLQRQLPENRAALTQRSLVEQQVQLVEQLLSDKKKQIEVGVAPPLDTVPLERELLGLRRELIAISKGPSSARAGTGDESADRSENEAREIQRLRNMLKSSPDLINAKGAFDYRPIHTAVLKGQRAVVEFLLQHGADPNDRDARGNTPLHLAALSGHLAIAQLLLERGSNVNGRSDIQATPLHIAANRGYKAMAELLLANGADINLTSFSGQVDAPDGSAASMAIRTYMTEGVPLCTAIMSSSGAVVDLLIAAKPDVNRGQGQFMTPLHAAVRQGSIPLGERLIRAGANIDATDGAGQTPLHSACASAQLEMAKWLIGKGAKVDAKNKNGAAPLHSVISDGIADLVDLLSEKGADVNARDDAGNTPLHNAVSAGQVEVVKRLLAAKAEPMAGDRNRQRPLERARTIVDPGKRLKIEALLRQYGAQ